MKREPLFKLESDLCAAFIPWAKRQGWTAYPETAGWDILLVEASGRQLGIQAKLKSNLKALRQTSPPDAYFSDHHGPDFRAVLVGDDRDSGYGDLCAALGIGHFFPVRLRGGIDFAPMIVAAPRQTTTPWDPAELMDWNPARRHDLPAYVPDVIAGASGPSSLTPWKIKALKICAILDTAGHVTRKDFTRIGIDYRRWCQSGWLVPMNAAAPDGKWVGTENITFRQQHPVVYPQILAELSSHPKATP